MSFLARWRGAISFCAWYRFSLQWLDVEVYFEMEMFTIVWLSTN